MNYVISLIAVVIGLGMAAVAGTTYEERAEPEPSELQQAHHSRDFAARRACEGKPFEWQGDVLVCFKEQP